MTSRRGRAPAPTTWLLLGLGLCAGWPVADARAEKVKVAVLPITGSDGTVETSIERALREEYDLVRPSDWDAAASRIGATAHKAENIAAVAREVRAQIVVTGSIKQTDGAWQLALSVRHGPTGHKADRLNYPLASKEVDGPTLQKLVKEIEDAASSHRVAKRK